MNKTLFGLALISYNWDNHKKDIIDSYIPLFCSIIASKNYPTVTREVLQYDLLQIYGINIQLGPIESILRRMVKDKILERRLGIYHVDHKENANYVNTSQKEELDRSFISLIADLKSYAINEFDLEFSESEIEEAIISFFKENDLNLLFANNDGDSVLPTVKESKKTKYIIAKYITNLSSNDPAKFSIILKMAKGHAIASLITYEEIQHFSGSLNDVEIYLDAPIIFNILGLNGESNLKLIQELIAELAKVGAKLRLFELNYTEVVKTLQDSIKRLTTRDFDLSISSRVLRTAIRENISAQQLQLKLNQVDEILSKFNILKIQSPTLPEKDYKYQIDKGKLSDSIRKLYNNGKIVPSYKMNQIERDVEAIDNIFKIRKNTQAKSLKSCKAIFLTSNESLAYASKSFENSEWEYSSSIPVCITDIFLSTILWANYPVKSDKLNHRQLISECYSIIELDNKLLNKYYEDVKKMHQENAISKEQYFLLSATNIAFSLLQQKTLNDIEQYSDSTPAEILEDLQAKLSQETLQEKSKLDRIDLKLSNISKALSRKIFWLLAVLIIICYLLLKEVVPKMQQNVSKYILGTILAFLTIFGFLRWAEIIPTRTKIELYVENFLYSSLKKVIGRD